MFQKAKEGSNFDTFNGTVCQTNHYQLDLLTECLKYYGLGSNFDTFNGTVYLSDIIGEENVAGAPGLYYVVFEPGVINNWHTHEGGQLLIATDGIGYHQVEGGEVEVLHTGDVAFCPPGVKHWHGGSANTSFAHIAVNTNTELTGLEWFDRISDEEYQKLPTE